jgi:ABC-2 type transport system ATP-binding protein
MAGTRQPTLAFETLRREFGPVTALDGVDLAIDGPEIVGIAGPNGAGKTTLIQCLLGLLAPTAGSARIDGTAGPALGSADRARIGYMPQEPAIYRDLTVRENVAFFASLYGVCDRQAAVAEALDFVDLADRADSRVEALSGGMVRRTSLACSIVHDPALLVLDEPTVGLDPALRAEMWREFRDRCERGTLVLVSTHYLAEVSRCDRALFLSGGRVLAFDDPASIKEATDTTDMEGAFLTLLDREADAAGGDRR